MRAWSRLEAASSSPPASGPVSAAATEGHAAVARSHGAERAWTRRWLTVAVGSLVVAGAFALLLVLGRTPPFDRLVGDPLFFKRCLVVHVDLSLVVWFYAFLAALFCALPPAAHDGAPGRARLATARRIVALALALTGLVALFAGAAVPGALPVLSNYIPAIDHPLFLVGLALFAGGLAATLLDARLLPDGDRAPVSDGAIAAPGDASAGFARLPAATQTGLRAAALAFLAALLTFGASALRTLPGLEPRVYYELVFWGGGHVLQIASVAALLAVWLWLVGDAAGGRRVLSPPLASLAFAVLLVPGLAGPLLAARGTSAPLYREGFTTMMQFGLVPVVVVVGAACVRTLRAAARAGVLVRRDPRVVAFATSAGLAALGFVLGALIRGSNTMVPAHYHASIGAVTAAFMGATWVLVERLGLPAPAPRLAALQPLLFGVGQAVFALGFAFAGHNGTARKAYGAEQAARGAAETAGLAVMGLGGLVAVAGGVLFLALAARALTRSTADAVASSGRNPCPKLETPASTRSSA